MTLHFYALIHHDSSYPINMNSHNHLSYYSYIYSENSCENPINHESLSYSHSLYSLILSSNNAISLYPISCMIYISKIYSNPFFINFFYKTLLNYLEFLIFLKCLNIFNYLHTFIYFNSLYLYFSYYTYISNFYLILFIHIQILEYIYTYMHILKAIFIFSLV